jgi:hypothetical protein
MPPIATLKLTRCRRAVLLCVEIKEANVMRKIYVSDSGKDKDDGLSQKTPIRSWQRFMYLLKATTKSSLWGTVRQGR